MNIATIFVRYHLKLINDIHTMPKKIQPIQNALYIQWYYTPNLPILHSMDVALITLAKVLDKKLN